MAISRRRSSQLSMDEQKGGSDTTKADPEMGESSKLNDPLLDSKESEDEHDLAIPDPKTLVPKFSHRPLISCFGKSVDKDDHTDLFWFKEGGEGFLREIIRMNLLMMAVFVAYVVFEHTCRSMA